MNLVESNWDTNLCSGIEMLPRFIEYNNAYESLRQNAESTRIQFIENSYSRKDLQPEGYSTLGSSMSIEPEIMKYSNSYY